MRKRIFEIIEKSRYDDKANQIFNYFIIFLIALNVIEVVVGFNESLAAKYSAVLLAVEIVSIVIFTIEYLLRLWTAKNKYPESKHPYLKFIFSYMGMADLLAFLPFYLTIFLPLTIIIDLRYLRLFRLLKIIKILILSNQEKQFVRQAFSTYLSPKLVSELIANPDKLNLGGEKREMSVLFTDLKEFSTFSENMDPTHLVNLLNKYFTAMSNIVINNQGTVDKYIGDAVVAFYGAPIHCEDHAKSACLSALAMKKAEEELNKQLLADGIITIPLFTRIGINTGEMVVGNMGSEIKMNYTVMGNATNLGARLEGINKQYKTGIIISEFTKNEVGSYFLCRKLDLIRVAGIQKPVQIFELSGITAEADPQKIDYYKRWEDALACFEQRKFSEAAALFGDFIKEYPTDEVAALYEKRCIEFSQNPPASDWDGVFSYNK